VGCRHHLCHRLSPPFPHRVVVAMFHPNRGGPLVGGWRRAPFSLFPTLLLAFGFVGAPHEPTFPQGFFPPFFFRPFKEFDVLTAFLFSLPFIPFSNAPWSIVFTVHMADFSRVCASVHLFGFFLSSRETILPPGRHLPPGLFSFPDPFDGWMGFFFPNMLFFPLFSNDPLYEVNDAPPFCVIFFVVFAQLFPLTCPSDPPWECFL